MPGKIEKVLSERPQGLECLFLYTLMFTGNCYPETIDKLKKNRLVKINCSVSGIFPETLTM